VARWAKSPRPASKLASQTASVSPLRGNRLGITQDARQAPDIDPIRGCRRPYPRDLAIFVDRVKPFAWLRLDNG